MTQTVAIDFAGRRETVNKIEIKVTKRILVDDVSAHRQLFMNFHAVCNTETFGIADIVSHDDLLCCCITVSS